MLGLLCRSPTKNPTWSLAYRREGYLMPSAPSSLRGYFDSYGRVIVGLQLAGRDYITAQIDTGFNGLLFFSAGHALELGIGLPEEYDRILGAGGNPIVAGEVPAVPYIWFGEYLMGTVLVGAPPVRGSLVRQTSLEEQEPMALIGTRMLAGCQLSIQFRRRLHFPVKIRRL